MSAAILLRGCNAYIRHLTISHNTPCLTPQKYAEPWYLLSHGNEFYLHWNEKSFRYQTLSTSPRFDAEAQENSEMAYSRAKNFSRHVNVHQYLQTLREGEGRLWTERLGTPRQVGCILKDQH